MSVRTRSALTSNTTLAALALTGVLTATPPVTADATVKAAVPEPVVTDAYFNRLGGNSADKLVDHLVSLIDGVPAEAVISGTAYRFNEPRVTDALIRASQRGAHVRIRTDAKANEDPEFGRLSRALPADDPQSFITRCPPVDSSTACIGYGSMHNKFFLFSKVRNTPWVVSNTSANLNEGSGTGLYNSTYTDAGNEALYHRFRAYFDRMGTETHDRNYYDSNPPEITGGTKTYFYPRSSGDTVESTLKETKCAGGGSIAVSMWSISRSAPTKELRRLAAEGCQVQVIAHHIYDKACENLTAPGPGQVLLHGFSDGRTYTHQKNILMNATYTGERHKVVFTGSANLNGPSLRDNDENVIRIQDNTKIFDKFLGNIRDLAGAADIHATSETDCKAKFNGQEPGEA